MKEQETLATEIMHELKNSATRWRIAFFVALIVEVCTIALFVRMFWNR